MGKKLSENGLEVEISKKTFGEKKTSKTQLSKMIKNSNCTNLFGKESVGIAINEGLANEKDVKVIAGVPHLQIYRLG